MSEEVIKIKITDKDTVTNVPSSSKVFINDNGAVKQVDASKMILKKRTVDLGDVTIGTSGYTDILSFRPTDITVLFCAVNNWQTSSKRTAFLVNTTGAYIGGTAGDTITALKLDYYYY